MEAAASINAIIDAANKAGSTFKDIMDGFNNFISLGSQTMQEATAKFDAQLDEWDKWTDGTLAPALQEEAQALEQLKIINDNVTSLVNLVLNSSTETQQDVQLLMSSDLSSTSDLVSAFNLALQELVGNMTKANTTIGTAGDQTGYVKQLDDMAVQFAGISAKFTACQNTIKNNMQQDSAMYQNEIDSLRTKA